ncbi:hypothetical protein FA15DRAFT_392082 [Coprinopsis marcescibilis]|uniref:Uncharacterized protein n=1 Tax=Coprinopsis marcescibilis TaxID=230819 RepID=A0A5C3K9Q4_COPMA|nr:hypothetical protein FA15DRAFT_392082 [Coprinopsis marcescibilis]
MGASGCNEWLCSSIGEPVTLDDGRARSITRRFCVIGGLTCVLSLEYQYHEYTLCLTFHCRYTRNSQWGMGEHVHP